MDDLTQKRAFTIPEAADYSCYSRGTIEGWIARGLLPYEEPPGRGDGKHRFRRVRRTDLDAFLDAHYQQVKVHAESRQQIGNEIVLLPRKGRRG